MTELLPCPFCGQNPEHIDDGKFEIVVCVNCNIEMVDITRKGEAVEAWNTRANERNG